MGRVLALHLKPGPGELTPVDCLEAVGGRGFIGDRHFGKKTRQALLCHAGDEEDLGLPHGALREQITVDLPELQDLAPGTRLAVGSVEFEVEEVCRPCGKLARRLQEDLESLRAKANDKRGMLAKVVSSGEIRLGDEVRVLA